MQYSSHLSWQVGDTMDIVHSNTGIICNATVTTLGSTSWLIRQKERKTESRLPAQRQHAGQQVILMALSVR